MALPREAADDYKVVRVRSSTWNTLNAIREAANLAYIASGGDLIVEDNFAQVNNPNVEGEWHVFAAKKAGSPRNDDSVVGYAIHVTELGARSNGTRVAAYTLNQCVVQPGAASKAVRQRLIEHFFFEAGRNAMLAKKANEFGISSETRDFYESLADLGLAAFYEPRPRDWHLQGEVFIAANTVIAPWTSVWPPTRSLDVETDRDIQEVRRTRKVKPPTREKFERLMRRMVRYGIPFVELGWPAWVTPSPTPTLPIPDVPQE